MSDSHNKDKNGNINENSDLKENYQEVEETEIVEGLESDENDQSNSKSEGETFEDNDLNNKDYENLLKSKNEFYNMLLRTTADFENYKKRVAKEKESIYIDAQIDAIAEFLPVVDNFERAIKSSSESSDESLLNGFQMLYKQFNDILKKLGVKEIDTNGAKFNPDFHNAVMHIDDENFGENEIIEEFQKGYMIREKVIRHSMVKVAN